MNPNKLPSFMTQGLTYLLPKGNPTDNPLQYRPVTCLQTFYKIMTSCLSRLVINHCDNNSILNEQQKGCRKHSYGCKEQLIIDSVITKQAYKRHRNLYTAYIDYKKAFDSVPHNWLVEVLQIYKISPIVIKFLSTIMMNWETRVALRTEASSLITDPIKIKTGIFQGDSLSPLWFCLALNPLTNILNETGKGFNIRHGHENIYKISHLMYMDDIKLYAGTYQQLRDLLRATEMFSHDICMEFGLDKCKTQCFNKGQRDIQGYELHFSEGSIGAMNCEDVYKYLGFQQGRLIEDKVVREELSNQYIQRIKSITKSKLNGKYIVKAINTYAVPLLTYSFGVIHWSDTDLEILMRKTRKVLTLNRMHHPYSAKERFSLPRSSGGRGFIDISNLHSRQKNLLKDYFVSKTESELHRAVCLIDHDYTPLNMVSDHRFLFTKEQEKLLQWRQKALHGKHANDLDLPFVDKAASNMWLSKADIYPETEGFMLAIQDQVICTKNYRKYIIKDGTEDDSCRQCKTHSETIHHITSGCRMLAQLQYKYRHDCVAKILHQELALKYALIGTKVPYYKYDPQNILETTSFKLYWDRTLLTDKSVAYNRPDIVLVNIKEKTTYLIDVAIPDTSNISKVFNEKMQKYEQLAIEVKEQWKMKKIYILPLIISATGVIPRTVYNTLRSLGVGDRLYILMQKSVILNTCNIVRRFINNSDA